MIKHLVILLPFGENLITLNNSQPQLDTEDQKSYNKEIDDQIAKDQISVYKNCIDILSNYIFLMKMTDLNIFSEDSFFMSSIMRLLRKNIQLLSNEKSINFYYRDNKINLNEFSLTFKVFFHT